jgi:hypothetical protein
MEREEVSSLAPALRSFAIRNNYKDDKVDEWKQTDNFTPTDLDVLAQLSGQALQEIVRLKQTRSKPAEAAAPERDATAMQERGPIPIATPKTADKTGLCPRIPSSPNYPNRHSSKGHLTL